MVPAATPVPHEKIVIIQKMLAKAESLRNIGNVEEAELFASKVTAMLLEYKLDMSHITLTQKEVSDPINQDTWLPTEHGIDGKRCIIAWQSHLATAICTANFCTKVTVQASNSIIFVGRATDRAVALQLYTVLVRTIADAAESAYRRAHYIGARTGQPHLHKGFKGAFITGAVTTIIKRLRDQRAQDMQQPTTAALVRVENGAVEQWAKKQFTGTHTTPSLHAKNMLGYQKGIEYGQNASLNGNALGGKSTPALH